MITRSFSIRFNHAIGLATLAAALLPCGFACRAPQRDTRTSQSAPASPAGLEVDLGDGHPHRLRPDDLRSMPRLHVPIAEGAGLSTRYEGVALSDLLVRCGVQFNHDTQRKRASDCVVVRGSDGYQVVFSMAEVTPAATYPVIVADRRNGQAIEDKEGSLKLIATGDKNGLDMSGELP